MSEGDTFSVLTDVILDPSVSNNVVQILKRIKIRKFKICNYNANIYFNMFSRFNTNYTLDGISNLIFESISKYRIQEQEECMYNVNDALFSVIPYFSYAQPSIEECFSEGEYATYPSEDAKNVIVPGVTGVAIYAFLESDISKYGIKGSRIIFDCIDKALLENVHVTKHGKFIYFDAEDCKTKKKLAQELDKKFSENGENFRDRSGSETELKLVYSDLSLSIVTKLI